MRIVEDLLKQLIAPGRTVIDVGCGTGGLISSLSSRYRCIGIDPSRDTIDCANQLASAVDFRQGTAAANANAIMQADLVLLMDVIEHVENDRALLTDIVNAMRPGSLLLIAVPAGPELISLYDDLAGHFRRYDAKMLRAACAGLPLRLRMITGMKKRLYWLIRLIRVLRLIPGLRYTDVLQDFAPLPRILNRCFYTIFAGERTRICTDNRRNSLEDPKHCVSLLAVFERE